MTYPKRLIEVDLPIKRISAHARREKSIRHGHISTLHIWWARRPLAACRAVICAALWPDPADGLCPDSFRQTARRLMGAWGKDHLKLAGNETYQRFIHYQQEPDRLKDNVELRKALLDFIADFANWDNSTVPEYLQTSRTLTQAAHEALGGTPGTRPLVVDPFAGGGSIPLEALRIGADAFASDLNPIPVLLNKVVLEYIPKYGQCLADEVRKWGEWIKKEAEKELAEFYPKDPDGAVPVAYLWVRTIQCEGPGCGAEVPLIRSLWLAKKGTNSVAVRIAARPDTKRVEFEIIEKPRAADVGEGTVKRGSATCPFCGFTMPVAAVRRQLKSRHGGASDPRALCVITTRVGEQGRRYRPANSHDEIVNQKVALALAERRTSLGGRLSAVPDESTVHYHSFVNRGPIYGLSTWGDYFTARQSLALATLAQKVREVGDKLSLLVDGGFAEAVQSCLAIAVSRHVDINSSLCAWHSTRELVNHVFARQALCMVWDFCEANPFSGSSGCFLGGVDWVVGVLESNAKWMGRVASGSTSHAAQCSATKHILPDGAATAVITDPPYYYSVQYADLSDYFHVWLRRMLALRLPLLFDRELTPKEDEIIVQSPGDQFSPTGKNNAFYESRMRKALEESRRVLASSGIGTIVFAHTSTAGWEAMLQATVDAGWVITGSWPIDTEMGTRVIAQNRSVLASSVHLVCRPRETAAGIAAATEVGDWRDVLAELPRRIHDWMPRLAEEGVVGADAIFACLGPALEIFSRYSRVEKASGEAVTLREYLEQVWAAVAKEALTMIFTGADATGFEEDARLTAMWLWTLHPGNGDGKATHDAGEEEEADEEESGTGKKKAAVGYALEYDAARKIAQGLGAHLEKLTGVVEVQGETARLLSVSERTRYLFGKDQADAPSGRRKKKDKQMKLAFEAELEAAEAESGGWGEKSVSKAGNTVLDRLHQAMILFAAGRSEALRRFLVDDGIGRDQRFWRLAQALSALYPSGTDEKRWVDGVLARKKGLGL